LVVAVSIILVVTTLGAAMALRATGGALASSSRQSSASAVSLADAGLADALYRIDQGPVGTGSGPSFCVKAGDSNCVASSVPAAPGVSYLATQVSPTQWTVQALAVVNGNSAAVEEQVTRSSQYPFVLFGNSSLNFNGNSTQAFSTYSDSEPASTSTGNPNPNPNGNVAIGSNGTITCNGGLGSNVGVFYYGTGGIGSTGSSSCGAYQSEPNKYYLATPAPPANSFLCPGTGVGGGQLGSGISGAPSVLAGGTYLCTAPVTLSGQLTVLGQVQLYVILDPNTYGNGTAALTITRGSYINDQSDYCANGGSVGCQGQQDLPNSQNLQIFSNSTGTFGNDNGQGYYFGGIIYAPFASLTGDGCKSVYYGSLVINTLTCNGGPHLSVNYDANLATDYGPWTAGAYTEINPATYNQAFTQSRL
jgi:hypothetical protein